jgi:hypothetical protein
VRAIQLQQRGWPLLPPPGGTGRMLDANVLLPPDLLYTLPPVVASLGHTL